MSRETSFPTESVWVMLQTIKILLKLTKELKLDSIITDTSRKLSTSLEMMAATATTLSRKEQRRQAANTLQRAGKRFVARKLEQRAQREAELEALRLSECVQPHRLFPFLLPDFHYFGWMLFIAETWVSGSIIGSK